jgi:hypothetical protein
LGRAKGVAVDVERIRRSLSERLSRMPVMSSDRVCGKIGEELKPLEKKS